MLEIERAQLHGHWGISNETALLLEAYLSIAGVLSSADTAAGESFPPRTDIVFRAVRWLVDGNQRFDDYSILHVFTYTAFYASALQGLLSYSRLPILNMTLIDCYDEIVWAQTNGERVEREERFRLAAELHDAQRVIANYRHWRNFARAAIIGSCLGGWLFVASMAGWLRLAPENSHAWVPSNTYTAFFSSLTITITLIGALWRRHDKFLLPPDQRDPNLELALPSRTVQLTKLLKIR